jgi:hypothetical protein
LRVWGVTACVREQVRFWHASACAIDGRPSERRWPRVCLPLGFFQWECAVSHREQILWIVLVLLGNRRLSHMRGERRI